MSVTKQDRTLTKLSPNFRYKVEKFLEEAWDKIFITEWFRSQARQNYLYSFWRTRKWTKVTWTLSSNHSTGNAIDIAFRGQYLYPDDIYDWREIAEIAKKHGIDWGYDLWGTDKPHFQDNWKWIIEKLKEEIEALKINLRKEENWRKELIKENMKLKRQTLWAWGYIKKFMFKKKTWKNTKNT